MSRVEGYVEQRRSVTRLAGALAGCSLGLCLAIGCSPSVQTPRNVVLVTIDTVAAQHLGCYGYERNTSPIIDAFAEQATRYTRAYATAPWTLPTHASLFTGKYPFEHGARTFQPHAMRSPLALRFLTVAEVLEKLGFENGAFTTNTAYLTARFQLDQGFGTYMNERVRAEKLNEQVFEWLEQQQSERFFLFVNYMDAHEPYNTRALSRRSDFLPHAVGKPTLLGEIRRKIFDRDRSVRPEDLDLLVDLYDLSIAQADEGFGALLDKLREFELYEDTLIILTSDHGEAFGQHDLIEHGRELYEELIKIPLIVKGARQRDSKLIDVVATSTDIPHLILSQLAEDGAESYLPFFPDAPGNHLVISENHFDHPWVLQTWADRFDRERVAVIDWPYKYIHSSDGEHELYHLEEDPRELDNRVARESARAEALAGALKRLYASRDRVDEPLKEGALLTQEERDELKALGYVSDAESDEAGAP